MSSKSKVVEAHKHGCTNRFTLLYKNSGSFTFEMDAARLLERKASYEGSLNGKKLKSAEIKFTEKGTKFVGNGIDANDDNFKLEGNLEENEDGETWSGNYIDEEGNQKEIYFPSVKVDSEGKFEKEADAMYGKDYSRGFHYGIRNGKIEYNDNAPQKS